MILQNKGFDEVAIQSLCSHDDNKTLQRSTLFSLCLALAIGSYLTVVDLYEVLTDFKINQEGPVVTLKPDVIVKKDEPAPKAKTTAPKKLAKSNAPATSKRNSGGNLKDRVTKEGVLGILSRSTTGRTTPDIFAQGGVASGIDKILRGVNGLSKGDGGPRRLGEGSMPGEGIGTLPGFGGGSGGMSDVEGLMNNLMNGGGTTITLKKRKDLAMTKPEGVKGNSITGKRSRSDIIRVVNSNMPVLKYAYNRFLRSNPGMKGKVTLKWAVDEFGNVLFCKVVSTTIDNDAFVEELIQKIKRWKFNRIEIPGDVTEVVYPFVFVQ